MKVACLQFAPTIGEVNENIARADQILAAASIKDGDLDLLALPELAFTGMSIGTIELVIEPLSGACVHDGLVDT